MPALSPLAPPGPGRRILVTGGAGFIGSHLCEALLQAGSQVVALDNFSGGRREDLPSGHPLLAVLDINIGAAGSKTALERALEGVDLVYHLASPIGVRRAHAERFDMVREILDASLAITAACREARVPLLAMSSSEVYGSAAGRLIRESDMVGFALAPRWGYAAGKFALEHLTAGLCTEMALPSWIVRPFNIAGPRQREETGLCIAAFAARLKRGALPEVHGDGLQRRAFLHVKDAVAALLLIPQAAGLIGQPVNLGHPQGVSIRDVAVRAIALAGRTEAPLFTPIKQVFGADFAEAPERVPDITRLIEATGWRPRFGLDDILRDALGAAAA